jgi:ribosomal protein L7Ae-like RNA K-turn-binding protein
MGKHKKKDKKQEKDEEEQEMKVKVEVDPDQMETTTLDESAQIDPEELPYEELVTRVSVIAKPLASEKLTKRVYRAVKKGTKAKSIQRGVKDVVKSIRKGETGFVVLAGDVSPLDVITHIPVYCEDRSVPYVYVPSKRDLGRSSQTKRPTSVVLVKKHKDFEDHYEKCYKELKDLPLPI